MGAGALALTGAFASSACSQSSATTADAGNGFIGIQGEASAPMGACDAIEQQQPIEGWLHLPECSYIQYFTKPPSSGDHYPVWAAYRTYDAAIPEGFFVHNLEHGSIVLSYNCPNGCDSDVAAAQAMIDSLAADPDCVAQGSSVKFRILMTPDPDLDVPFAASAWGWTLRAQCFDPVVFGAFVKAHSDQGREDICADGQDLSTGVGDCGAPPGSE